MKDPESKGLGQGNKGPCQVGVSSLIYTTVVFSSGAPSFSAPTGCFTLSRPVYHQASVPDHSAH
jgi:hypothetical protein